MHWDWQILIDRRILDNRFDFLLVDKMGRYAYFVDVVMLHNNNIRCKYGEKVKYKPLVR